MKCSYGPCDWEAKAKGFCAAHYNQNRRGQPLRPRITYPETCTFEGCDRPFYGRGYCGAHYQQHMKGGPLRPVDLRRQPGWSTRRDDLGRKQCGACQQWKPESAFSNSSVAPDRKFSNCKECQREHQLKHYYRLTRKQYDELTALQSGGCAICGRVGVTLHVDHDHNCCPHKSKTCGECVRGLLCGTCNRSIGMFNDDPALLRKAALYLENRIAV